MGAADSGSQNSASESKHGNVILAACKYPGKHYPVARTDDHELSRDKRMDERNGAQVQDTSKCYNLGSIMSVHPCTRLPIHWSLYSTVRQSHFLCAREYTSHYVTSPFSFSCGCAIKSNHAICDLR